MASITDKGMQAKPTGKDQWLNSPFKRGAGVFVGRITPNGERLLYFRYTNTLGKRQSLPIGPYHTKGTKGYTLADAYAKALVLSRDDNLSIERAEVLAQKNGGSFAGEPWSIIQRVLTADPHHLNALFLAGSASYAEMNFTTALRYWERAREVVPADSPDAPELDRAIAEARSKMGLPAIPPRAVSAAETQASKAALAASSISGRVTLVKELQGLVAATDTVFVYATPVAGSRMPVAIVRTTADKLPFDFVLDDSTAMNPSTKLSGMDEVTVRVRISKSGQAVAQPGDYGVSLTPVKPGSKGLNLMVRDTLQSTAQ